jgi:hypothetical protein
VLAQQVERPPDRGVGGLAHARVAVEALRESERGEHETAAGHRERAVPGRGEALRERVEVVRERHRVPARVVAGDRGRREHRCVRRKRPVGGRDAPLGAKAVAEVAVEPGRRRARVTVRADVIRPERVDVEEDDRARRRARGDGEGGLREEERARLGSGAGVLPGELELERLVAAGNLRVERMPAAGLGGERHHARASPPLAARDGDAQLAGRVAGETLA